MTDADLIELGHLYSRQFGTSEELATAALNDCRSRLVNISLEKAQAALMELAMYDTDLSTRPAPRLVIRKLITKCLGTPVFQRSKYATVNYPPCDVCNKVGLVEVPHPKGWIDRTYWDGEYTCVVACMCEAGSPHRMLHRTLANYEAEYANWREELVYRRLVRRVTQGKPGALEALKDYEESLAVPALTMVVDGKAVSTGESDVSEEESRPALGDGSEEEIRSQENREGTEAVAGAV